MNIEITPKKTDGLERMIEVVVPLETVRDAEDEAAKRYATSVRLPGFRPGKAPPAMIKKRFKDAIRQQVVEKLVQDAFKEVIDREQLKVASQPHVHDLKFEDGQPLSFELHLEIRPELNLARTQGFRVTKNPVVVSDDTVRDQFEQIRDQKAAWTPVEDKPAPGDMVRVSSHRRRIGRVPEAGNIRRPARAAIPGVRVDHGADTGSNASDRFGGRRSPDEMQLANQASPCTLLDVKRKSLPPLDDALAREVGASSRSDCSWARCKDLRNGRRASRRGVRQQLIDRCRRQSVDARKLVNQTNDGYQA
jgi:trigger factor